MIFLIVHHSIDLFHLPTLMHNSLFINNTFVSLQSSTCFEHQHAHLPENKLYYHRIWYHHSTVCRMRADCRAVCSHPAYCTAVYREWRY